MADSCQDRPVVPVESRAALQPIGEPAIQVSKRTTPTPSDTQVLVKVFASGVCAADVELSRRPTNSPLKMRVGIGGHEGAGQIVALGPNVDRAKWNIGDRVAVRWIHQVCLVCEMCTAGHQNLCPQRLISGKDVEGTFAEYMLAESTYLARIPDQLDYTVAAPILCAGLTVYKALKVAALDPGSWVAFGGAGGGLGHLGIQYAKAMGLKVVAIDQNRREVCSSMGADIYIDVAETTDVPSEVIKVTGGGIHGCIMCAPAPKAYADAASYLRVAGILVCIALSSAPITATPTDFVIRGITVMGSSTGTVEDTEEALNYVARGEVKPLYTEYALDEIAHVLDKLEVGEIVGKAVLKVC
ncbi:alcohol dehydrogenase [Paramyrothecium foliicola]|nr:alcohol dehydrogenase [Paramyrothecium foliicola]